MSALRALAQEPRPVAATHSSFPQSNGWPNSPAVSQAVEVSAAEAGTIHYDWYIDEEAGTARLYEAHESAEAVSAHVGGRVFTELLPLLASACNLTHIDAFGDPEVLAAAAVLGPVKLWGMPFEAINR